MVDLLGFNHRTPNSSSRTFNHRHQEESTAADKTEFYRTESCYRYNFSHTQKENLPIFVDDEKETLCIYEEHLLLSVTCDAQ